MDELYQQFTFDADASDVYQFIMNMGEEGARFDGSYVADGVYLKRASAETEPLRVIEIIDDPLAFGCILVPTTSLYALYAIELEVNLYKATTAFGSHKRASTLLFKKN